MTTTKLTAKERNGKGGRAVRMGRPRSERVEVLGRRESIGISASLFTRYVLEAERKRRGLLGRSSVIDEFAEQMAKEHGYSPSSPEYMQWLAENDMPMTAEQYEVLAKARRDNSTEDVHHG